MSFLLERERRVPLSMETRKKVYERAKGRCESCGIPLKMKEGEFHHLREPTAKSRPSTIQFLCPTCHKRYGHDYKTITRSTIFGTEKITKIIRKRVRKHKSPYWNEKSKKKAKQKRKSKLLKRKEQPREKRPQRREVEIRITLAGLVNSYSNSCKHRKG